MDAKRIKITDFTSMLNESKDNKELFPCMLYVDFYTTSGNVINSSIDIQDEKEWDEALSLLCEFISYLGKDENRNISINGLTINSKFLVAIRLEVTMSEE